MIVYHGSYCIVDKPNVKFSRDALDFGKGFYVTTIKIQAENWTKKFKFKGQKAYINIYDLPIDEIKKVYNVKEFKYYDNEWLEGIGDMHCKGEIYLTDELMLEYGLKEHNGYPKEYVHKF